MRERAPRNRLGKITNHHPHVEQVEFHTADGLRLSGELAVPVDRAPEATLVLAHPLPTHQGSMDSPLFQKLAARLPGQAALAVLRFNSRGTVSASGASEGQFSSGKMEPLDLAAASEYARSRFLPQIWLVGWSFGTDVVLLHGPRLGIVGAILLAPPFIRADDAELQDWAASGKPLTVLVPEFDDYLRPAAARQRFALVPQAKVIAVPGAGHLFLGERSVRMVLATIVETVRPSTGPQPSPASAATVPSTSVAIT